MIDKTDPFKQKIAVILLILTMAIASACGRSQTSGGGSLSITVIAPTVTNTPLVTSTPSATSIPPATLTPVVTLTPEGNTAVTHTVTPDTFTITNTPEASTAVTHTITLDLQQPIPDANIGDTSGAARYTYEIINAYPHNPTSFTQGLVWQDGILYEGTGQRGQSSLRRVVLETGEVQGIQYLADQYFGEGITVFDGRVYQLTWKSNLGFIYDQESLALIEEFQYPTEGWGITHDGDSLIMSDGTATLYFLDPETLAEIGRVEVIDDTNPNNPQPVAKLNELEFINGEIYANVWLTDRIVRINPETGQVTGWLEMGGLLSPEQQSALSDPVNAVLNGIAYDAVNDRLFVTGKLWPTLYEIELVPQE